MYFLRALLIGLACGSLAAAQAHSTPRAAVDPTSGATTNPLAALPYPPSASNAPVTAVPAFGALDQLLGEHRVGRSHTAAVARALVGSFARIAAASSDDHARRVTAEVLAKHGCSTEAVNQMPLLTGFEVSLAAAGLLATPTIELRSSHESSICAAARDAEAGLARGEINEWNYGPYAASLGRGAPFAEMDPLHVAAPADRLGQAVGINAYLSGDEEAPGAPGETDCKARDCAVAAGGAAVATGRAFVTRRPVDIATASTKIVDAVNTCSPCVTGPDAPPPEIPQPPPETPEPATESPEPATDPVATNPNDDENATHGTCSGGASGDPMRCDELRRTGFEAFQAALEELLKHCPLTEAERALLPEYDPHNFIAEPACDEAAVARDLALLAGEAEAVCPAHCQEQKAQEEATKRERERRERMEACGRTTPTSDDPHDPCASVRADLVGHATSNSLSALLLGSNDTPGNGPTTSATPFAGALQTATSAAEVVAAYEASSGAAE